MALYDTYLMLSVVGLVNIGLNTGNNVSVNDSGANPGGDNSQILGDVGVDTFTSGLTTFTFVGVAYSQSGDPIGFIGSTGSFPLITYTMFVVAGTSTAGISVEVLPRSALDEDSQWNLTTASPVCLLAGTQVSTPDGPRLVEDLEIGDLISTADGEAVPVKWVGRQTILSVFAERNDLAPIRISAGALGPNVPVRDLYLSSDHAVAFDGLMVQAGALVNGSTITRVSKRIETYHYYHVEVENHLLMLAEGTAIETYVDNVSRSRFDNYAEYITLYGEAGRSIEEANLPRIKSARQLPRAVRETLESRCLELGFEPETLRRVA